MSTIYFSNLDIPPIKDTRVNSGKLSQLDYIKFLLASKILNRSLSANAQSALTAYIRRNWPEHEEAIQLEAKQAGLSVEEFITKLLSEP
jgi:hypothetical protein